MSDEAPETAPRAGAATGPVTGPEPETQPGKEAEAQAPAGTVAPGAPAGKPEPRRHRRRRRGPLLVAAAVVLVAAAGGAVAVTDPFGGDPVAAPDQERGGAVATVREGPLSAQVSQVGTLSYAARPDGGAHTAVNQSRGIYTSLPAVGDVIKCGETLYGVADRPVPLLCGSRPFYRDLAYGDEGRDVKALNRNLLALGHAGSGEIDEDSDEFGAETREALINLQDEIGAEETGRLKLGDAVLLPGPLRVTRTVAQLGTRAVPGSPVVEAGTTSRQVRVELNASQQTGVKTGDRVRVTLPDNRTTPGRVSRIGTIATSSSGDGDGGDREEASASGASTAALPVYITLERPKDAGSLDQAPVQVQITTAGVKKALTVPVTALVGLAGGRYAVERVTAAGGRETVPVTLGLFDSAGGQVQVTGALAAGDRVAVPST
ncbi:efflux RND transporter periplasmic adaptor subunit [Streptomyces sp. NPDC001985]|uniref:hypothetical protein n=1 Tax=Streptomyces sp. NPDC001985 TaxID=3154406 RepID=UPI003326A51F